MMAVYCHMVLTMGLRSSLCYMLLFLSYDTESVPCETRTLFGLFLWHGISLLPVPVLHGSG